ncbi:Sugar phosphate isomerase/epimerase [Abditibacterium utsteinense]|uniref:Sugar phosphate isomerase/epimerase n=1 Tax=Abditibacterium utsteinense TaxID=1960156 RepID=A0A2S8SRU1_9BACT|nr:sugar phosphate isomerase/epimerase [Abditibacterium utsteinense]PQV63524.1 Sugar phosphate isomerase/epimerase [Abditibacterium utsteinense]
MNLSTDLGVQSFCFRHFKDNAQVAQLVRECGLDKIELCAVHVDFSDESSFDRVIETYRQAGVQIVSIGVQGANGEEAKERSYFEFARRAGAKHMSVHFGVQTFPECYRVSEKLSAEFDVFVGVHNHGGYHWLGNSEMLERVFKDTNERIGLCLDTAWALDARQNPIEMAQKFAPRWYGAHIKDFVFDRARNSEDVVVGTGNLDLPALVKLAGASSSLKFCVLEYEGDVENPVPALKECVEAVRGALK